MTIFAVVGWVLFAFVAVLYYVGNKLNTQETGALENYSLALLLSDDFRSATLNGFDKAIQESNTNGFSIQRIAYGLKQGVNSNAKNYYVNKEASLCTLAIVLDALEKRGIKP